MRGNGTLNVSGYSDAAGIGAGRGLPCGAIYLWGNNTINATGYGHAAGIGGSYQANCGNIYITGGTITANGGNEGGAGIGAGSFANCGNISISGGTIVANGGYNSGTGMTGAGIGGGGGTSDLGSTCGNITISGGNITSNGGGLGDANGNGSAGIGSARYGYCGTIDITGGTIVANGGNEGAAIGGGRYNKTCGAITIGPNVTKITAKTTSSQAFTVGKGNGGSTISNSIDETLLNTYNSSTFTRVIEHWDGDLAKLKQSITVRSGVTISGTLSYNNSKITVADGATITLNNATISGINSETYKWAGLNCLGNATINLVGNNTVKGFYEDYPGIYVPEGSTLTIQGSGSLTASSNGYGAGIGGGHEISCGNIVINGGTINATGSRHAAGIGSGYNASCGAITINSGVTSVVATTEPISGSNPDPIGAGYLGTSGSVSTADGLSDVTIAFTRTITRSSSPQTVDLETVDGDVVIGGTATITGELSSNCKISIANGAHVTLDNVTIEGWSGGDGDEYKHAAITCLGNATITLAGENFVRGFYEDYPGIYVPPDSTLTIEGSGSLVATTAVRMATGQGWGAGIGGGYELDCGNIVINGGNITAIGGTSAAGIGGGYSSSCGDITITGGTVTATGGEDAAGIGGGVENGTCGTITIGSGITLVSATRTRQSDTSTGFAIGRGYNGTDITTTYADNLINTYSISTLTRTLTPWDGDLAKVKQSSITAGSGVTIRGTLSYISKISIADGASITLDNATISLTFSGTAGEAYKWAGINCLGDATINLVGNNTVKGFYEDYPGIYVPEDSTLTIQGSGSLTASSNGYGAGIGGGHRISCGNIVINGGTITATGGGYSAGIGAGNQATCGYVTVNSGVASVVATCGNWAVKPIGAGHDGYADGGVTVANVLVDCTSDKTRTITLWDGDLAKLSQDSITVGNGMVMTGTLSTICNISVESGASITLEDVSILPDNYNANTFAGLTCLGNATITLVGDNFVRGNYEDYPGIYVPPGSTLTIQGSGSLTATSNGYGAGIGGGHQISCGNIVINGGTINATGSSHAAGIGSGYSASCGTITINSGVTRVVATCNGNWTDHPIGAGNAGSGGNSYVASALEDATVVHYGSEGENIIERQIASRQTETIDGIEWSYYVLFDEARILKKDNLGNFAAAVSPKPTDDVFIPDTLGGYPVTSIGRNALAMSQGMTSLTVPETVTSIGVAAFADCNNLKDVRLPEGLESIGEEAFRNCTSLAALMLPSTVTSIHGEAFKGCYSLETIYVPYGSGDAIGALISSAGISGIAVEEGGYDEAYHYRWYYAFNDSDTVRIERKDHLHNPICAVSPAPTGELEIPRALGIYTVTGIGDSAFYSGDEAITSVTIPDCVTEIGSAAFYGCSALTEVFMPGSVTTINNQAFDGCADPLTVYVGPGYGDQVTSILTDSGHNMNKILVIEGGYVTDANGITWHYHYVQNPSSEPTSDPWAVELWSGVLETPAVELPDGVTDVVIPDTIDGYPVVRIGGYAFYGMSELTSVEIPEGVTSIGTSAFSGCDSLTTIKVPAGKGAAMTALLEASGLDLDKVAVVDPLKMVADELMATATIDLTGATPTITINTLVGFTYTVKEGATIGGMTEKEDEGKVKVGDGNPWTPTLKKYTNGSGFYSIQVDVTK